MKELLNVGMDPTPWQRGGKKRWEQAEWGQVLQIKAADGRLTPANESTPTFTKSFWDSMWSLGGCILMEICLLSHLAPTHTIRTHPAVFGRILDSHFTGLEHAGLLYLVRSSVESPG
jgi:hypothetical protein